MDKNLQWPINLSLDGGPIVFLGSMNAMPMMYALELKNRGYNVIYFVDAKKKDTLHRPENHFTEIEFPYPSWVIELDIISQILLAIFPRFYSMKIMGLISKVSNIKPQAFFLNGFFISLAPYLYNDSIKLVLSHGSDLDTWANISNAHALSRSFCKRSIFKFLPFYVSSRMISSIVNGQFNAMRESDGVIYFPKGFNSSGDTVVNLLIVAGVSVFHRYDISFKPIASAISRSGNPHEKLIILSAVRFLYRTFPDSNADYSKGNEYIIRGLSDYYKVNRNIEIHFIEKGEDVTSAKVLCNELGLSEVVVWHKEMPFRDLISLYEISHVCFDQVGIHWIGAIGGYALYLDKCLIANDRRAVDSGVWPECNPVFSASTSEEVFDQLKRIQILGFKPSSEIISGREFVEEYMSPISLLKQIFSIN